MVAAARGEGSGGAKNFRGGVAQSAHSIAYTQECYDATRCDAMPMRLTSILQEGAHTILDIVLIYLSLSSAVLLDQLGQKLINGSLLNLIHISLMFDVLPDQISLFLEDGLSSRRSIATGHDR